MRLTLTKRAMKGLDRMPNKLANAMLDRLETIATAPFAPHANVKPLQVWKDAIRLRQGGLARNLSDRPRG